MVTANDGSTLYVGGEFDDAGGTWTCQTFQASCLSGKVLQRAFAVFGGTAPAKETLSVATAGAGAGSVTSNTGGINCGLSCVTDITAGTPVTLTPVPQASSIFTGWSGDCTGTGSCVVTMNQAHNVTATFSPPGGYSLTVNKTGAGGGTVTSSPPGITCGATCSNTFTSTLTLTAVANGGSAFNGWSSSDPGFNCPGTDPCTVTMDRTRTVTADFESARDLSVTMTGGGGGSVTSAPTGISCTTGTCTDPFVLNSNVTLTATPSASSAFAGWSGADSGTCGAATTCQISMSKARSVTAAFNLIQYPLTVTTTGTGTGTVTSPAGISCPSTCSANVDSGSVVTLSEASGANSTFTGWSGTDGSACGTSATCQITMSAARIVTATFELRWTLNVSAPINGSIASDVGGITCGATCAATYLNGTVVNLTATPAPNYVFTGWTGDCSSYLTNACPLTMITNQSVSATFAPSQTLDVVTAGTGGGTVTSDVGGIDCVSPGVGACIKAIVQGTTVNLTATPDQNSTFTGWSGSGGPCDGTTTSPCAFTMDADTTVTATFTRDSNPLNLTIAGVGGGTGSVASTPAGISCSATCSANFAAGTPVTLTATPDAGSSFAWSGGCSGTSTCQVTMSSPQAVTVTFTKSATTTVDDNDPAIAYNGWFDVADAAANGGFYRMSNVKNDKATWKSPATTSITWVTRTGPDQGKASVTIDGTNKGTVDLYSASPATLNKVYGGLANKVHTVVIKVLGTKNTASTGFNVRVDAFVAGSGTTQESDPGIQYDTWKYAVVTQTNGGSWHSASTAAASATVTFTGTSIDWITATGKAFGKASVTIDGVSKGTFDLYTATTKNMVLKTFGGLSSGAHTMVIQVLGTKNASATGTKIVVDGFTIHA